MVDEERKVKSARGDPDSSPVSGDWTILILGGVGQILLLGIMAVRSQAK